ncbi:MAG: class I SAM-dependent methyltransferase [Clostridium sp.]
MSHKFDVKKLDKLNNPKRLDTLNLDLLLRELNLDSNSVLVDVGTGTGFFAEAILNKMPDAICFGFDISKDMLSWIKENKSPDILSRFNVQLMEESKIPLADNFADLVFMIAVYHELENPRDLLKEASRVLKPNGKLLICDWKEGSHHHFVKKNDILEDLNVCNFKNLKEIDASEPFLCLISST